VDTVWIVTFDSCDETGECREVAFIGRTEAEAVAATGKIAARFNATVESTERLGRSIPRGGWHGGAAIRQLLAR
jgi:hypothetical protein